jgi:hypothetical protein
MYQDECPLHNLPMELLTNILEMVCKAGGGVFRCVHPIWKSIIDDKYHNSNVTYMSNYVVNTSTAQWAKETECPVRYIRVHAASSGNIEVLEWTHDMWYTTEDHEDYSNDVCSLAASGGHLNALQWARKHKYIWDVETCTAAAKGGHIEVLKWARENKCDWNKSTSEAAMLGGHLELLKWAIDNGCPKKSGQMCIYAALSGNLECLKYARNMRWRWDQFVSCVAALKGHLNILEWVYQKKYHCNWQIYADAASGGHLHILKWAHRHNIPFVEGACYCAAKNGHLEVLIWLISNGCPWDKLKCLEVAQFAKQYDVIELINEKLKQ